MKTAQKKEGGYKYILFSVLVILTWGVVPCFAKLGSLSGGLTTMYVNWFAVVGVLVMMVVTGNLKQINRNQPYKTFAWIGLIWPLGYSLCYFTSIDKGTPSLTTITNYFWPVFALLLSSIFWKRKYPTRDWLIVLLAVVAVAIPIAMEGSIKFMVFPIVLGLVAALAQAFFNVRTQNFGANRAWILTLVISLVAAVGSTIYVLLAENLILPDIKTIGYLGFLGVISNAVGFWAFQRAGREAKEVGNGAEIISKSILCLTPLVQVAILPLMKVETISSYRWIGVIFIAFTVLGYRFNQNI